MIVALTAFTVLLAAPPAPATSGDAVIRGKAGGSEIVITTTNRLAGAIHSLTWNGKEFIDSFDHGRQLQSACSFDCGKPGPFHAECYNPTEAGGRRDGHGQTSTSKLLEIKAAGNELSTRIQAAFWVPPGEKTEGRPAFNDKLLSDHVIAKRVRIGYRDLANVIEYSVAFTIPPTEDRRHKYAQFEALTGYMPAEFGIFRTFDPKTGKLEAVTDGPGEQRLPLVFSTAEGGHAMAVFSPDQPSAGFETAGYGRNRFVKARVTKWNCVFRVRNADGVPAGDFKYRIFVAVGTAEDVRASLAALAKEFAK